MMNSIDVKINELKKLATSQQRSAANPENSVWVEASAGTGKTKVLSDRVLRLLLEKVNPAKILCLTYTKAASVEMNERIAKRLSSWAVEDEISLENELSNLLGDKFQKNSHQAKELLTYARTAFATLLDTPGGMKIQTIHSFCQDILKRFPLEAGVSPYFDVMDERRSKEILQEIKTDLLKQADMDITGNLAQSIVYLTNNVSEYKFPEIMNMITDNRSKISTLFSLYNNDIAAITAKLENRLGVTLKTSEADIKTAALRSVDKTRLKSAAEIFSATGGKEDMHRANVFFTAVNNNGADVYDIYKTVFLTAKGEVRVKLVSQNVLKTNPDILTFMAEEADRVLQTENALSSLKVLKSTSAVLVIAQNIIDKYNDYKNMYATFDYEDLIIITRHLLENSSVADWVLFKLDGGIDHILIDEAQDTSPNQWAIIRALTQEFFAGLDSYEKELPRTVFVVGDRKQSIYSFQGADPAEFDRMYRYFNERIQNFTTVHLDVSFRSTAAIMDCVNMLFEVEAAKKGVVPPNEHINHRPFRIGDGGRVEILPPVLSDDTEKKESYNWKIPISRETRASASNTLARLIASNIKKMVERREILASKNRPVQYGDFMFLVQQRKSFVEEFVRACKEIGVNVAGVDKLKLLEQIAVQDLISLGKFLLLPTDDLSLAEALKSPLFNLTDDDLFALCCKRKGTLFNSLLANPLYAEVAIKLKDLSNLAGYARPFELFNTILVTYNGRRNFIERIGTEVEDVLDEFLNLTLTFEQSHTPTLETFISWILQDEVVIQKEMEQGNSNTVKIMTVHGSKGLQAPIVILADTTKIKNKARKSEFLWSNDNLVYFPTSADSYDKTCTEIKNASLDADFDEYRRLLYVALTRAEDRLYIAGFSKNANISGDSWYKLISENLKSNVSLPAEDKRIVYDIPQTTPVSPPAFTTNDYNFTADYSAILQPAPVENPLAKPFAPSRDENDETESAASPLEEHGKFYRRGTAIHTLLQYIGNLEKSSRESAALTFLQTSLSDFSAENIRNIAREVLTLCDTYPEIFSADSKAEVPIIGEIDGKIISAKVDRLIVLPEKVIIVDYKTNRPAAKTLTDVPDLYLKQLTAYKKLLEKIYSDRPVETYLLWTNTCNMMKV